MPPKLRLLQHESFDGFKDLLDHITTFKMTLSLQQLLDGILCHSFPTPLKGAARVWFSKQATSSIDNFEQLGNSFISHFIGGQHPKRPTDHLLTIRQGEKVQLTTFCSPSAHLRLYMKRFTREVLEVDQVDDKVQLTTFKAELKSREFVVALAKSPSQTMAEMLLKAQKYMNAEDALAAIGEEDKPKEKEGKREDRRGRKRERGDRQSSDGSKQRDDKTSWTVKFTPLVMPIDKILMQIKDDNYLKCLKPLHSSPNVCNKRKYCLFHKDHGYYIEDCRDLKEQIEELIQKGKLYKFVKKRESSKPRNDNKEKHETVPKDEDNAFNHP